MEGIMKKIISFAVSVFCLVAILVFCLSCGQTGEPGEETSGSSVIPKETLELISGGNTFKYTVMRPDMTTKKVEMTASAIRQGIADRTGLKVLIDNDFTRLPNDDPSITEPYEILVGVTNRQESKAVLDSLPENGYAIKVLNHKIVIIGVDDDATWKAGQVFLETVIGTASAETPLYIDAALSIERVYTAEERESQALAEWEEYVKTVAKVKSNAQIISTKYETNHVVVADIIATDYEGVDPTGQTDSTSGIQKALNACYQKGGGTVWLPEGKYLVTKTISIPNFVTLQGDWQNPDLVTDGVSYGTVILAKVKSQDDDKTGLFVVKGSGGAVGLTVYYPEQSLADVKPYPHAFYIEGDMLSNISHVTVINGYRGVGACLGETGHEQLSIENVYGTFLYTGFALYNSSDVGTVLTVHVSPKYWAESKLGTAPTLDNITNYTRNNTKGFKIGDLEWTEFADVHVRDCEYGVYVDKGVRIAFAGSFYDLYISSCDYGIYITDMDTRWGMALGRASIEGSVYALVNDTKGYVKSSGVTYIGEVKGSNIEEYIDETSLEEYGIDYTRTYVKPNARLYIAEMPAVADVDATAAVQAALNQAAETGGIVYVPAGSYLFKSPLIVPANVELRGASSVANRCQGSCSLGTMFYVTYGTGPAYDPMTAQAFITLNGDNAGVSGIRIFFTENDVAKGNDGEGNSVYAIRGKGTGVYVVNCGIVAAGYGVDFRNCDRHYIKKLVAWCYENVITAGGKDGMIFGNLSNATVMFRTQAVIRNWPSFANEGGGAFRYSRYHLNYLVLMDADGETLLNTFTYGCSSLVTVINSVNVKLVNIGSDNIGETSYQMVFENSEAMAACVMRYNGYSYSQNGGFVALYSRLAINEAKEKNIEWLG